jgi:dihydrofolate synthase/folylpolyglutamate synthase
MPISDRAVADGLANVVWPARLEVMARRPLVLLDCAHNVASAQALVQALDESFPLPKARRILIFGGNRDKDIAGMLDVLAPRFDRIYLTSFHGTTRCLAPEQIAALVPSDKQTAVVLCTEPSEAYRQARREARTEDLICITGSVFLAGELRPMILDAR